MRSLAAVAATFLLACGGAANESAKSPASDQPTNLTDSPANDVPQVLTCCVTVADDGLVEYQIVPIADCPEDGRSSVEECDARAPGEDPT